MTTATMMATGGGASSGTDGSGDTTASPSPTGDSGGQGTGGDTEVGGGPGDQPASGMYSDCLTTKPCVGTNTCVTIFDNAGAPFDGFCTLDNCVDAATDCAASPGGQAQPACVDINLNGVPASVCALDCSGNITCPGGMVCYEDAGVPVCA